MPAFVVTPDHYPDHEPGTAILGVDAEPQAPAHLIPQAADGEWDEETLEELAARIQEAHVAVARASAAVVAFAVTAGRLLLKARARVPVGSWGPWLECNCKFSVRTAQDYMRIARAFDERLIDPQHAADSLREVLFTLRKKRATGEEARETAADGWRAYPGELDPHLVAWDKVRRRFVGLTKQLGDVRLADADSQSRDLFRKLVRETIADIWKHTGREARAAHPGTDAPRQSGGGW
ncbi:MAG: DUF3102 domain-containing protein [Isosphaeraceae bacterium]